MTTPTQAQIETAMESYDSFLINIKRQGTVLNPENRKQAMALALTAAAQVGDVEIEQLKRQLVSWQIVANQGALIEAKLRKDLLTVECCTIERCARVAEKYSDVEYVPPAIRRLKEET